MGSDFFVGSKRIPEPTKELSDKEDPQREKAYAWERDFWHSYGADFRSIHRARVTTRKVCDIFRIRYPTVVGQPKNRGYSCYRPDRHRIQLLKVHWNPFGILHEAAHAVAVEIYDDWTHGRRWMGIFLSLLIHFGILPKSAALASAKAAGLEFMSPGWVARLARRRQSRSKRKGRSTRTKR